MTIISTDIENTGDGFDFSANNQTVIVKAGVVVASDQNYGIFASGYTADILYNSGSILSSGELYGGLGFYSVDGYVENEASGVISGWNGLTLGAGGERLLNAGQISGEYQGINGDDSNATITNSGAIEGGDYGILLGGGSNLINNSGLISGRRGISLSLSASTTTTVSNAGHLNGPTDALDASGAGALAFTNSGTLSGDAALTNTGGDTVRNTGTIDGAVQLGNGTNSFDGRGGAVSGEITGGSGVDTIRLGNDGEIVNGGAGHDKLYSGRGADTFAFTSDGTSSDHIYNFNVSTDTIELAHSTFAKLTVGATPAFSIGTHATGPTDYLFYNNVGGGLWYDPDGTGSQAAVAIANLGPGLKLTAHDFTVV